MPSPNASPPKPRKCLAPLARTIDLESRRQPTKFALWTAERRLTGKSGSLFDNEGTRLQHPEESPMPSQIHLDQSRVATLYAIDGEAVSIAFEILQWLVSGIGSDRRAHRAGNKNVRGLRNFHVGRIVPGIPWTLRIGFTVETKVIRAFQLQSCAETCGTAFQVMSVHDS